MTASEDRAPRSGQGLRVGVWTKDLQGSAYFVKTIFPAFRRTACLEAGSTVGERSSRDLGPDTARST